MAGYLNTITKTFKPSPKALYDDILANRDPDFFQPTGTQVYCGMQGSGKTISAVKHAMDLKERYPKAILVTNLSLTGMNELPVVASADAATRRDSFETLSFQKDHMRSTDYFRFSSIDELMLALKGLRNGKFGVIYLIDEIHTYFNSLDSKSIPPEVFTQVSQQRKQRKLIVGTSQLFARMAKPFREQCDNLIFCATYGNLFTVQRVYDAQTLEVEYDGSLVGDIKKRGWFFHTRDIRSLYDTYQIISTSSIQSLLEPPRTVINIDKKAVKKWK